MLLSLMRLFSVFFATFSRRMFFLLPADFINCSQSLLIVGGGSIDEKFVCILEIESVFSFVTVVFTFTLFFFSPCECAVGLSGLCAHQQE